MKPSLLAGAAALGALWVSCSSSGKFCACAVGVNGVEATVACGESQCVDTETVTCDKQGNATFGSPSSCSTDGGFVCVELGQPCAASTDCCNHYESTYPTIQCDSAAARCCMEATGACTDASDCCAGLACNGHVCQ